MKTTIFDISGLLVKVGHCVYTYPVISHILIVVAFVDSAYNHSPHYCDSAHK